MNKTVRQSITLPLALLLGIILFVGCGGGNQKGETLQVEFYSFTLLKGWYLTDKSGSTHYDVKNEAYNGKVVLGVNAVRPPEQILPDLINQFSGNKQIDNVTINGINYFVVENKDRNTIDLLESKKGANAIAIFSIRLNDISIEQATPLLKTLKMNGQKIEIDEDAIKAKIKK
jgi:hypothetical protein